MSTQNPAPMAGGGTEDVPLLCPHCGYDVRAAVGNQCSECGNGFDRDALRRSGLPWVDRGGLGRLWAYAKTVWRISVDSGRLAGEPLKVRDPADARRFRAMTASCIAIILLSLFAVMLVWQGGRGFLCISPDAGWPPRPVTPGWLYDLVIPWSAGAVLWPVPPIALVLFANHLAGAQRRLFQRRGDSPEQRQRLAEFGTYVGGPWAWLLPLGAASTLIYLGARKSGMPELFFTPLIFLAGLLVVLIGMLILIRSAQWASRTDSRDIAGWVAIPMLLGLWLGGAVLFLGALPWCVGFLWIVLDSFL